MLCVAYNGQTKPVMDREIPKKELRRIRTIRIIKIAISIGVAIVAIVVLSSLMRSGIKRSDIRIGVADRGTLQTSVQGSGRVAPAFEQIINSPVSSRIVEVYRKEGDTVGVGTPLLRLDLQSVESELKSLADERRRKLYDIEQTRLNNQTFLTDMEMKIEVKEMAVSRLGAEVVNERRLDSIGSGTGDRVRQAEFAYETARLELEQLRLQLENERRVKAADIEMKRLELSIFDNNMAEKERTFNDASLRSPRQATLTFITDQIGRNISQGEKVAVISDLSHFKITAEIADNYADRVSVGSKVVIRAGSKALPGTVTRLTPQSRNGIVEFSVVPDVDDDPQLRSGLKTEVHVLCDVHSDVVRIPSGPYFKGPGFYDMFVSSGGKLHRRKVQLGDSNYDFVEVVSGIVPGDSVVTSDLNEYKSRATIKLK